MKAQMAGAVLVASCMLLAAMAGGSAGQAPPRGFWVDEEGLPRVVIVVGDDASSSDVVSSSIIAQRVGTMAMRTERHDASPAVYSDMARNIPLAHSLPAWEATIPSFTYNIPGTPAEDTLRYYKSWGATTHWTASGSAYAPFFTFGGVKVEYTLGGLWFYDEDSRTRFFTHPDGAFSAWETHEEIQIRFDDLYLCCDKEEALSGLPFQDHNADLAGGDVSPVPVWTAVPHGAPFVPGLIYRIDNVRRPPQLEVVGYATSSLHDQMLWVDFHALASSPRYIPTPDAIRMRRIPRIALFGHEYEVVDATFLWDFDMRYGVQDGQWNLGDEYAIITGRPRFYAEQYLYKDMPIAMDGYEILVRDIDVDHNKIRLSVTTPPGDTYAFWMVTDPMHGFSATPQLMSQTGEVTEYNGWSENDVWVLADSLTYRDNAGHAHLRYAYPLVVMDGIATFIGAGGATGALFNIYTLTDVVEFRSRPCCLPYVDDPFHFSLWIDQQNTADPCIGNFFSPSLISAFQHVPPAGDDLPNGVGPLGDIVPGTAYDIPYNGPWWSADSHCTTTLPLPPTSGEESYSYAHFPESLPDAYADRDPNDYLWLFEDGFRARKQSHLFLSKTGYLWDAEGTYLPGVPGGDFALDDIVADVDADYVWEMNFALCDVIESVKCTTKWVINGPNNYFRIEISDITWDDNGNGWPYLGPPYTADGSDDGVDFRVLLEVSGLMYTQTIPVRFDPSSLIRLDVEVSENDLVTRNLVLVGGPVANRLVSRLISAGTSPDDGADPSWMLVFGDFKLYTNGFGTGTDVLVVAGPDREETRRAAEELVSLLA